MKNNDERSCAVGGPHRFTEIVCLYCGHSFSVPVYCGNRFCPICSRPRLNRVRKRINWLVKNNERQLGYVFKHLTLTIKSERVLSRMCKAIVRSFRKLRNRSYWKDRVAGGAFVDEVTRSDHGFHAHLHCIIYAKRIDWEELLRLWRKCSSGRGVYIQNIPPSQITRYLSKYISKPTDDPRIEIDVHEALKGMRLFHPFGSWYNLSQNYEEEKNCCPFCGSSSFLPLDILYQDLRKPGVFYDSS